MGVWGCCESTKQEVQGGSPENLYSMEFFHDRINFTIYLAILKVVPGTFWDWDEKPSPNLDFQIIFDIPLAKYLIGNKLLECIGYISTYLLKSE